MGRRGREGERHEGATQLGPGRHGCVERFQSFLQTLPKAFALPLTADVISTYSPVALQHEGRSAMNAPDARASRIMGLRKSHDTGDVGWGLGGDG